MPLHQKEKAVYYLIPVRDTILIFILLLAACTRTTSCHAPKIHRVPVTIDSVRIPFDLSSPDRIFELPDELKEISGIALIDTGNLACIQDEDGNIYIFNIFQKRVTNTITFAGKGDYEDIEVVDGKIYVIQSNGHLFCIEHPGQNEQVVTRFQTPLSKKNDCEGLCYDPETNSLLIACKGSASPGEGLVGNRNKKDRAVFRFDLTINKMDTEPFLLISLDTIEKLKGLDALGRFSYSLASTVDADGNVVFQPSGIAIEKEKGYIYLLASVGKSLLVLDRGGHFLAYQNLPPHFFGQPEGICFTAEGDLFISNEGKEKHGTILFFKRQQKK
jgi:uncharacterized protein YjiK